MKSGNEQRRSNGNNGSNNPLERIGSLQAKIKKFIEDIVKKLPKKYDDPIFHSILRRLYILQHQNSYDLLKPYLYQIKDFVNIKNDNRFDINLLTSIIFSAKSNKEAELWTKRLSFFYGRESALIDCNEIHSVKDLFGQTWVSPADPGKLGKIFENIIKLRDKAPILAFWQIDKLLNDVDWEFQSSLRSLVQKDMRKQFFDAYMNFTIDLSNMIVVFIVKEYGLVPAFFKKTMRFLDILKFPNYMNSMPSSRSLDQTDSYSELSIASSTRNSDPPTLKQNQNATRQPQAHLYANITGDYKTVTRLNKIEEKSESNLEDKSIKVPTIAINKNTQESSTPQSRPIIHSNNVNPLSKNCKEQAPVHDYNTSCYAKDFETGSQLSVSSLRSRFEPDNKRLRIPVPYPKTPDRDSASSSMTNINPQNEQPNLQPNHKIPNSIEAHDEDKRLTRETRMPNREINPPVQKNTERSRQNTMSNQSNSNNPYPSPHKYPPSQYSRQNSFLSITRKYSQLGSMSSLNISPSEIPPRYNDVPYEQPNRRLSGQSSNVTRTKEWVAAENFDDNSSIASELKLLREKNVVKRIKNLFSSLI